MQRENGIRELLREWHFSANSAGAAIEARDDRQFRHAYRDARRKFQNLKARTQASDDGAGGEDLPEDAQLAVAQWMNVLEELKAWQEETVGDLETARSSRRRNNKLGRKYKPHAGGLRKSKGSATHG